MQNPLTFLIADDEPAISMALEMFVSREFKDAIIHLAENGQEAWRIAQNCLPDIILSDLSMPEMNGLELCHKVRNDEKLNDAYFIILTAHLGKEQRSEAILSGADDFLTKPFSADELLDRLREADKILQKRKKSGEEIHDGIVEVAALKNEEQAASFQKIQAIDDQTAVISAIFHARVPELDDALQDVAELSRWIATQLGELSADEIHVTTTAARVCLIGKMFLNDTFLKAPITQDGLVAHEIMSQVPISAERILSASPLLKPVATILRHLFENMDGTGFPDRLQAWQIPLGSRIIRPALDYTLLRLQNPRLASAEIVAQLARDTKRLYESRVMTLLGQYAAKFHSEENHSRRYPVQLQELQEGMTLAADIITNSGLKLLPAGAVLNQGSITKIISHNTFDHIVGTIYAMREMEKAT